MVDRFADNVKVQVKGPRSVEGERSLLGEDSRRLLDGLLESCFVLGFDWTFLYVNEAAAQFRTGRPRRGGSSSSSVRTGSRKNEESPSSRPSH